MRLRSSVFVSASLALLAGTLLSIGCGGSGSSGGSTTTPQPDTPSADVGPALYKPAEMPKLPPATAKGEALVIPNCTVQYEERQQVAAEVEGKIDLLATRDD